MRRLILLALIALVALPASAGAQPLRGATRDVALHVEPADGYAPVLALIRSARRTLDFTIYQFNDGRIEDALIAAHRRGVAVRVSFTWQVFPAGSNTWDTASENYNTNMPTLRRLRAAGVAVRLSPFMYTYSHQKTLIADGATRRPRALIMDFNAQPSYFLPTADPPQAGTRGFAIATADRADVREIQAVFDADWARVAPPPYASEHLIWSPNGAGYAPRSPGLRRILAFIDGARRTLRVYALLLDYRVVERRLIAAARRGVDVAIVTNRDPAALTFGQVRAMDAAGIRLAFDPQLGGRPLFVHTKAMIRDAGTANRMAFVGSQNTGDEVSMQSERELGILIAEPAIVDRMARIFDADRASATPLAHRDGQPVDPYPAW